VSERASAIEPSAASTSRAARCACVARRAPEQRARLLEIGRAQLARRSRLLEQLSALLEAQQLLLVRLHLALERGAAAVVSTRRARSSPPSATHRRRRRRMRDAACLRLCEQLGQLAAALAAASRSRLLGHLALREREVLARR
jgi:hypothetical protein